jgi:uncharacterized protein YcfJ
MWRGMTLAIALFVAGCAPASTPSSRLLQKPRTGPEVVKGEITVKSKAGEAINGILPVDVNIANGTDQRRPIRADTVYAINAQGQRVGPIDFDDAARAAGGTQQLEQAMKPAATGMLQGAAVGALIGAMAACRSGGGGDAAAAAVIAGAAVGAAIGLLGGASNAQEEQQAKTREELASVVLCDTNVQPGQSINGYVFFPAGDYKFIEIDLPADPDTEVAAKRIENNWH